MTEFQVQPISYGGEVQRGFDPQNPVAYHKHTGLDSPKLDATDVMSGGVGEIFLPAEAMNPTTTSGCAILTKVEAASNAVDYWVLDFDTTTSESCFFTIRMPYNWNASTVTFQFIWTNAAGLTTETVAWGIKGRAYADASTIDATYGTEVVTSDTWIAQNVIHITGESTDVTPAGTLAAGQWAQFKISRKTATDNMTGDARLIGLRLLYKII